jgi:hypothetical protein
MEFNDNFKKEMVKKLLMPGGKGATELSREIGISTQTLYNWRNRFKNGNVFTTGDIPSKWRFESRIKAIFDYSGLSGNEKGEWLRKNGLKSEHLELWKTEFLKMTDTKKYKEENRILKNKNKTLEKELLRKDKALAEVSALLILKKKVEDLFSVEKDI